MPRPLYFDSPVVIKAMNPMQLNKNLWTDKSPSSGNHHQVEMIYVPGHQRIDGNEKTGEYEVSMTCNGRPNSFDCRNR